MCILSYCQILHAVHIKIRIILCHRFYDIFLGHGHLTVRSRKSYESGGNLNLPKFPYLLLEGVFLVSKLLFRRCLVLFPICANFSDSWRVSTGISISTALTPLNKAQLDENKLDIEVVFDSAVYICALHVLLNYILGCLFSFII